MSEAGEGSDADESAATDLALAVPLALIPVLAAVTAGVFWWAFGLDRVLVALVPFAALIAAVTVIDLRELRIPNRLTAWSGALAPVLLVVASTSNWPDLSLIRAILGAGAYGLLYLTIVLIYPGGMGFGDAKLAPVLGAVLGLFGWIPLVRAIVISHTVSGVVAIVIMVATFVLRRGDRRNTYFPFGPFMVVGALAALVLEGVS